jgi:very-short-patch-repair endonuclease
MAAVLACGGAAVLSHICAAALHSLVPTARATIDVTVAQRVRRARPGLRIHCSTCLTDDDRTAVRGVPCTTVARTLLDLAAVVPRRVLERACDQAEILRLVDWAAMHELLAAATGRRGIRPLRAVLGTSDAGDAVPHSELERKFLALCRRAALPSPAVNVWLAIDGEEIQLDFVWHAQRVVVETDGFRIHGTRRAFHVDRRRDRLLGLAGWDVVRFTWEDLASAPDHVATVLRDLLRVRPSVR